MVLTGVALAAVYWLLESLFYFFSTPGADFLQRLSGTDSYDSWTRIFVLCLFAIFGSHVQYTMNKRRESDARLQESESKYRTIIESMEEGYFEVDLQGTLTFVNGGASELTFPLETFDNTKYTGDKRVILRLSNPVDVLQGFIFQSTATIKDDESFDPLLVDDFEKTPRFRRIFRGMIQGIARAVLAGSWIGEQDPHESLRERLLKKR